MWNRMSWLALLIIFGFKVERDVATIVHCVAFLAAGFKKAAEVVGPRAVGGEFHHIVFAHRHIVEGNFIHLVGHFCHFVDIGIRVPGRIVELANTGNSFFMQFFDRLVYVLLSYSP